MVFKFRDLAIFCKIVLRASYFTGLLAERVYLPRLPLCELIILRADYFTSRLFYELIILRVVYLNDALVAQRIERCPPKAKVVGSIPTERALIFTT